ncbi:hypothetical protein WMY93_028837 [Mugilogobius chulae]|uniref:Schwannomin interacting protein 1 C-terminal domain-containing protein n=1 Tax=Mugilogobius chulae TaxID=88201 RepID=A0AAW0N1U1_9GOBI
MLRGFGAHEATAPLSLLPGKRAADGAVLSLCCAANRGRGKQTVLGEKRVSHLPYPRCSTPEGDNLRADQETVEKLNLRGSFEQRVEGWEGLKGAYLWSVCAFSVLWKRHADRAQPNQTAMQVEDTFDFEVKFRLDPVRRVEMRDMDNVDTCGVEDIISHTSGLFLSDDYKEAQKNERESIRQKLALGSFFDDGPGIYTSCSKSGKPSLSSRLQSGMNLQICFVNDSGSDKDSDADDSKTETSLDTPLSPMSKQSSSYSDRDTTEEDSESLEDMDFLSRQKKLQAEAKLALAMAKPMAKMQVEVEKQNRKKSPVADLLPHMPHISECLMKRSLKPTDLRDMTVGQLQVIVNDLHSQIESLNEELVQLLLIRDELHMEQDAMLVDIEDLTRHAESQQKHLAEKTLSK